MGYTTYIKDRKTFTNSDWKQLTNAAKLLVSNAQLFGSDGTGTPIIDDSDILFNADALRRSGVTLKALDKALLAGGWDDNYFIITKSGSLKIEYKV